MYGYSLKGKGSDLGPPAHHHYAHGAPERGNTRALLSSLITSHVDVIADLGCGRGFYSKYLLDYANRVYCVDVDKEALLAATEAVKSDRMVCINASAENTDLPSKSVDIVFMANSFHDMENKNAVVNEISRILKERGSVIIIDWNKNSKFGPPSSIKMSPEDYIGYFRGFNLEKLSAIEGQHYCMLLKKA
ncbi:MAG: class I SAM-dependent methyltransferase [Candidatus Micrarchaeaceae archaeon]